MRRETNRTAIPRSVKEAVYRRDGGLCIFCGMPGDPVAHVIRRSRGGMGIEQNIITACQSCHRAFDEGVDRKPMYVAAVAYLKGFYPDWNREDQIYRKGM